MRMKKEDTIAFYRDQFLAGKNENYKNKFEQKTKDQQYIAIMNWKRNAKDLGNATGELAKVTVANVVAHLKNAHKTLVGMVSLSPKESLKLQKALDSFKETIDNFDRVKKQQLLAELQNEQVRLQKEGDNLSKKIEELKQELG